MKNIKEITIGLLSFGVIVFLALYPTLKEENREPSSLFYSFDRILNKATKAHIDADGDINILLDNNKAFKSKVNLIKSATDSIKMSYFIYATDHSTSVISEELIKAANRGVKVELMVDYFSNYKALDHFSMMEAEGAPNLTVKFYNRPSYSIVRDAVYLTMACPNRSVSSKDCSKYKKKQTKKIMYADSLKHKGYNKRKVSNAHTHYSGMFLSGLYSKNVNLIAAAVIEGQNIDTAELLGDDDGQEMGDDEKSQLKELAKIYIESKTGNALERIGASAKLKLALLMYRDQLGPLKNIIDSIVPSSFKTSDRADAWEHLTDFTHHKLLLVDNQYIQLGGRNLENSYHMDLNPLTAKYTFMDTDVVLKAFDATKVTKTFDEMFNYYRMAATLEEVRTHAPNREAANLDVIAKANESCESSKDDVNAYTMCKKIYFNDNFVSRAERHKNRKQEMHKLAKEYKNKYRAPKLSKRFEDTFKRSFKVKIDSDSSVSYLENVHYYKKEMRRDDTSNNRQTTVKPVDRKKTIGAKFSSPEKYGKEIHHVLRESFRNICEVSEDKPQRVILHNAYTLPPSIFLAEFSKMIDGTYNCKNVTVEFLTNSEATTDLGVVNQFAKYGISQLFKFYKKNKTKESAKFSFYEYRPLSKDPSKNLSLHSKVFILGDDAFIGSANLDPRSYLFDTNNGFYFKNVKNFTKEYGQYFDKLISSKDYVENKTNYYTNVTLEEMLTSDVQMIKAMAKQYSVDKKVSQERIDQIALYIREQLLKISKKSKTVIEDRDKKVGDSIDRFLELI